MINMRFCFRGLAAALLCVTLFWCAACSREERVYQAGLEIADELEDSQKNETDAAENAPDEVSEMQKGTEVISEGTLFADGQNQPSEALSVLAQTESGLPGIQSEVIAGYVYVCGAVNHPGVYPIDSDMRVFEAIDLAGGFTPEADEQWLNQAEMVQDGQRLYVYSKEETMALAESGVTAEQMAVQSAELQNRNSQSTGTQKGISQNESSQSIGTQGTTEQKVNINTADRELLMTLPGIGEAKAEAILQYREQNGAFGSIEEIQNISGIKTAVFSQIKDHITVQ